MEKIVPDDYHTSLTGFARFNRVVDQARNADFDSLGTTKADIDPIGYPEDRLLLGECSSRRCLSWGLKDNQDLSILLFLFQIFVC